MAKEYCKDWQVLCREFKPAQDTENTSEMTPPICRLPPRLLREGPRISGSPNDFIQTLPSEFFNCQGVAVDGTGYISVFNMLRVVNQSTAVETACRLGDISNRLGTKKHDERKALMCEITAEQFEVSISGAQGRRFRRKGVDE